VLVRARECERVERPDAERALPVEEPDRALTLYTPQDGSTAREVALVDGRRF
jgi:hypothetical protein